MHLFKWEKMHFEPYITSYTKTNSKRVIAINIKAKTIKLLKENKGEKFHNQWIGIFLCTQTAKWTPQFCLHLKWRLMKEFRFMIATKKLWDNSTPGPETKSQIIMILTVTIYGHLSHQALNSLLIHVIPVYFHLNPMRQVL